MRADLQHLPNPTLGSQVQLLESIDPYRVQDMNLSMWEAGQLFISSGRVLGANWELFVANGTPIADTRQFRYMHGSGQILLTPKYHDVSATRGRAASRLPCLSDGVWHVWF